MRLGSLKVDFMPDDEKILGFSNRWYTTGLDTAQPHAFDDGLEIRVLTPPIFVATKLEAFQGRGNDDLYYSRDAEDLLLIVDGREELLAEISAAGDDVRAFIAKSRTRHRLTCSFRAKEFVAPTIEKIDASVGSLVVATDGFWAELNRDQQIAFMGTGKREASDDQDDCSVLVMSINRTEKTDEGRVALDAVSGLYLRRVD